MPLQWSERLSVGVPEVDEQHRELIQRVGSLGAAVEGGDRDEIRRLVAYLADYALRHFEDEERAMRARGYPGYRAHKEEHDAFVKRYLQIQRDLESDGASALLALRLQNWLGAWLEDHLAGADQEMGRFFRIGTGPERRAP